MYDRATAGNYGASALAPLSAPLRRGCGHRRAGSLIIAAIQMFADQQYDGYVEINVHRSVSGLDLTQTRISRGLVQVNCAERVRNPIIGLPAAFNRSDDPFDRAQRQRW